MRLDTSNKFQAFVFSDQEKEMARAVSPYFFAYLQNKIASYAAAALENKIEYDPDPSKQTRAILEHERLRNFVAAYEELLAELETPQTQPTSGE